MGILGLIFPAQPYVRSIEKLYGGMGALLGIFGLVLLAHRLTPQPSLLVVSSMGASAVLLFAAPHSPMAQPWAFAGGHIISAISGVTCYHLFPDIFVAAAAAVSTAIVLMHFTHCLHPPGGATALFAVTGGDAVHNLNYLYVLHPVGLNVVVFLSLALLINNILIPHRSYPFSPVKVPASKPPPTSFAIERVDIEAAIKEMGRFIDVSERDLEEINAHATMHAKQRLLSACKVSDVMQKEVMNCESDDSVEKVCKIMRSGSNHAVPIIDKSMRVIGIVTLSDLFKFEGLEKAGNLEGHYQLDRANGQNIQDDDLLVGDIMRSPTITVRQDAKLDSLLALFSWKIHDLPVVDDKERLVGMISQSHLLMVMNPQGEAG